MNFATEMDWDQSGTLIMQPLFILHFAASPGPKVPGFSIRQPLGHSREGQGCLGSFGTNRFGSSADREQPVTAHLASFVYLALCSVPLANRGAFFDTVIFGVVGAMPLACLRHL